MLIEKFDKFDQKLKGRHKRLLEEQRRQQHRAMERIVVCFGDQLSDADRRTLAGVLVVEENALQLCEAGTVGRAISLLKEQEGMMTAIAVAILKRIQPA